MSDNFLTSKLLLFEIRVLTQKGGNVGESKENWATPSTAKYSCGISLDVGHMTSKESPRIGLRSGKRTHVPFFNKVRFSLFGACK